MNLLTSTYLLTEDLPQRVAHPTTHLILVLVSEAEHQETSPHLIIGLFKALLLLVHGLNAEKFCTDSFS